MGTIIIPSYSFSTEDYIYWCDSSTGKVERSKRDGSDRQILFQDRTSSYSFSGLVLDATFVYLSQWNRSRFVGIIGRILISISDYYVHID